MAMMERAVVDQQLLRHRCVRSRGTWVEVGTSCDTIVFCTVRVLSLHSV